MFLECNEFFDDSHFRENCAADFTQSSSFFKTWARLSAFTRVGVLLQVAHSVASRSALNESFILKIKQKKSLYKTYFCIREVHMSEL